jgi:hypothetical protein
MEWYSFIDADILVEFSDGPLESDLAATKPAIDLTRRQPVEVQGDGQSHRERWEEKGAIEPGV